MRRIVGSELFVFAVVVVLMAGCSSSSSPEVATGRDITEAEYDIVLPDSAEAINLVAGEKVGEPTRLADDPSVATSEQRPAPVEIADGATANAHFRQLGVAR